MTSGVGQVVFEFLTATGTGLYTLCGVRCWDGKVPENAGWSNTQAAMVFSVVSDRLSASGNMRLCLVSFRLYGGSGNSDDVEAVYEALRARLGRARRVVVASGRLERGALSRGTLGLRDPDTEWPYGTAEFEIDVS